MKSVNYDNLTQPQRRALREKYIIYQRGLCYHCKMPLDQEPVMDMDINESLFPKNFFKWPVHLHHNHSTAMTIGAVHAYCNAVLWQYHGE